MFVCNSDAVEGMFYLYLMFFPFGFQMALATYCLYTYAIKTRALDNVFSDWISAIIIQQIRALPIYGQNVSVICHPYITDILQYT